MLVQYCKLIYPIGVSAYQKLKLQLFYFTRCIHACMHACVHIFFKSTYDTSHMFYITLEIKLELNLLRLRLDVMAYSTGLIVHIIYACMQLHDHIWIFNNFLTVLKIIFSNRPIYIQKIGAPTLLVQEMHTCIHACMHTIFL